MDEAFLAFLVKLRELIDATLTEYVDVLPPAPSDGPCPHRRKEDIGTFGRDQWRCLDCGAVLTEE